MKYLITKGLITIIIFFLALSCSDEMDVQDPRYRPSHDITSLLIEDLEAGNDISLDSGVYYVSESIIVEGYCGTISGAGKGKTIIEPLSDFKLATDPYILMKSKLAIIFAIYYPTCDITFRDMTFRIRSEAPAPRHTSPFFLQETTAIDNVIVVSESKIKPITVTFRNLEISGRPSNDLYHYKKKNVIFPLIATGWNKYNQIDLIVENCKIDHAGYTAIEYYHGCGGTARINNNIISNSNRNGIWLDSLEDCTVIITNNQFENILERPIDNLYPEATICFMNNTLDGQPLPDNCPQ